MPYVVIFLLVIALAIIREILKFTGIWIPSLIFIVMRIINIFILPIPDYIRLPLLNFSLLLSGLVLIYNTYYFFRSIYFKKRDKESVYGLVKQHDVAESNIALKAMYIETVQETEENIQSLCKVRDLENENVTTKFKTEYIDEKQVSYEFEPHIEIEKVDFEIIAKNSIDEVFEITNTDIIQTEEIEESQKIENQNLVNSKKYKENKLIDCYEIFNPFDYIEEYNKNSFNYELIDEENGIIGIRFFNSYLEQYNNENRDIYKNRQVYVEVHYFVKNAGDKYKQIDKVSDISKIDEIYTFDLFRNIQEYRLVTWANIENFGDNYREGININNLNAYIVFSNNKYLVHNIIILYE